MQLRIFKVHSNKIKFRFFILFISLPCLNTDSSFNVKETSNMKTQLGKKYYVKFSVGIVSKTFGSIPFVVRKSEKNIGFKFGIEVCKNHSLLLAPISNNYKIIEKVGKFKKRNALISIIFKI